MTAVEGVDYAWDRPTVAGLAAAGKRFVVRYGGPGSSGKQLDAAERDRLLAAGLSIVANAEGAADGLLGGRTAGVAWARDADAHFRALGMPADRPIYLSVDFDATDSQLKGPVADALLGARSVLGADRVGVYGSYKVVQWARANGLARWLWQTYAWSGGRWASGVHLRQYKNHVSLAGGTVDLCQAMTADYGQWGQEDDMPTAEEIADAVWNKGRPLPGRVGERMTAAGWSPDMPPWEAMARVAEFVILGRDRLVADVAAAVAALPAGPGPTVDYNQLADAIVRRVLTGGVS